MHSVTLEILKQATTSTFVIVGVMFILSIGVWATLVQKWLANHSRKKSFDKWREMMGDRPSFQELLKLSKSSPDSPQGRITKSALEEM